MLGGLEEMALFGLVEAGSGPGFVAFLLANLRGTNM